jgi:hypothetical protein
MLVSPGAKFIFHPGKRLAGNDGSVVLYPARGVFHPKTAGGEWKNGGGNGMINTVRLRIRNGALLLREVLMSTEILIALGGVIVAFLGLIVAFVAFLQQTRDTHLSLGVQLLRELEREFDSKEMRKNRSGLAKLYLKQKLGKPMPGSSFGDHSELFDFFTTIGLLLKRGVLDVEFVWTSFYYWFVRHWEISEPDIQAWRKQEADPTYWEECDYLYQQLVRYDAKRRGIPVQRQGPEELMRFIKEQSDLS